MDTVHMSLVEDWKFHYGDASAAWYKGYDDSDWKEVTIPHDWAVTMPFSESFASGTGYLAGGVGWYRLHFQIPEEYRHKRISIVFDGVYKNSKVWCNSYYLGFRPNGYVDFAYDISDLVTFGESKNVLSVSVCHTDISDSRWFTGSGITRKVSLRIEEPVHAVRNGIFFSTDDVNRDQARITVRNELQNDSEDDGEIRVTNVLYDDSLHRAACVLSSEVRIRARGSVTIIHQGSFSDYHLWSNKTPYLYSLHTYIKPLAGADEEYMADCSKVGIRTTHFDPDHGFFLNGESLLLKGICVHHDGGCLGAAVWKEVWKRRLIKLKEMGANALRCAHNPHMPEVYELCDELGLMVMDEAFDEWENPKNKWWQGHNVYPPKHEGYYEAYPQWHEKDLSAMVMRDRNHPSVILWCIGNEIDYPNDPYCHPSFSRMFGNNDLNKPAQELAYDPNKPNAARLVPLAKALIAIVKRYDTTRPVLIASAFPELSMDIGLYDSLDVVGYNYKEHLYEEHHQKHPRLPVLGSENNHDHRFWQVVKNTEYISGQFLWTGIDFLGEAHGWPMHGSGAGLLTTAGYEKEGYFKRQAFWLDVHQKPVVNLLTTLAGPKTEDEFCDLDMHYDYQNENRVHVRCYTNCHSVELEINGASAGIILTECSEEYRRYGFVSWDILFDPGTLRALGRDAEGQVLTAGWLQTAGPVAMIKAKQWQPEAADALVQIEVSLADRAGNTVLTEDRLISVAHDSNMILVGIDNGDLVDNTDFLFKQRRTHQGKLIIYLRKKSIGKGEVILSAQDLPNTSISIE